MTAEGRQTVAVVGAGIAGLAAAWELVTGPGPDGAPTRDVHVLEASDRIGGKLRSTNFAGRRVDLAADAFVARRPEGTELCRQLGLTEALVAVGSSGASIWVGHRLRTMPDGLNLGVPTRWWPLARSRVLSPAESLRVARDLVSPHIVHGTVVGDRSVGEIVGERLGHLVVERLVDPLIGGINAGGVEDLSAAATFPLLLAASGRSGSLMHRLGRSRTALSSASTGADPAFWSLTGSTASLAERLAAALIERGVHIHTGTPVKVIERGEPGPGGRWQLALGGNRQPPGRSSPQSPTLRADGIVLAVPATEAAVLLAPHTPDAADLLRTIEYASVAVVTLSLPVGAVRTRLHGTGFLVPRTTIIDGRPALITGCTYLGRKWPHLARPGDELFRASVGRFGDERHRALEDDELVASAFAELAHILDVRGTPLESLVTRWPGAFPQYRVGHLVRVGRIEQAVAALDGMAVAGAAFRGVGIPACVGSGRVAAQQVLASLSEPAGGGWSGAAGPERDAER